MVTTVRQVLHPFFIICFIIGLGFHTKKQSRIWWIVNTSILYSLTIWCTYVYLTYYTMFLSIVKTLFRSIINIIILEINILTAIVSVIISHYHQKRFTMCLKKLAAVDDTLEELGSPKMYQKMHVWSKRVVIGWIICSLTINFYQTFWWPKKNEYNFWKLYISHIINCAVHINAFVDLLFIFFLWNIGTRFDKVNEIMRCLLVKEERGLRCTWEKPVVIFHRCIMGTDSYKQTLWILMHLHLELCRLARELNLIFGTQMTFEMASYLLYLTALCYYLCRMVMTEYIDEIYSIYDWIYMSLWLFLFSLRLYAVNYMCESVSSKANKIDKIIHQLTSTLRYADVWKEICQFILQAMYHQLKFTGMGLFYFGNSFFWKFCTAILTFVIIMMQLNIS